MAMMELYDLLGYMFCWIGMSIMSAGWALNAGGMSRTDAGGKDTDVFFHPQSIGILNPSPLVSSTH
ncbi:hypothetical protein IAQ61_002099 [Plenodomus lingam]|uniref:uncharacterized protein n=1 Tax=Leptosphaeria maculans TaxID=5022 RepID=UPI00332DE800|nr:hypothetical protein IAQ61_002099 [Plenodomus lingam]